MLTIKINQLIKAIIITVSKKLCFRNYFKIVFRYKRLDWLYKRSFKPNFKKQHSQALSPDWQVEEDVVLQIDVEEPVGGKEGPWEEEDDFIPGKIQPLQCRRKGARLHRPQLVAAQVQLFKPRTVSARENL